MAESTRLPVSPPRILTAAEVEDLVDDLSYEVSVRWPSADLIQARALVRECVEGWTARFRIEVEP